MCRKILKKSQIFLWLWFIACVLLNGACHIQGTKVSDKKKMPQPVVNKIVVMGFRAAMSQGEKSDVFRDSLSGGIYMAEPVSYDVVEKMTVFLFDRLVAEKRYILVSPGQAKGIFSNIVDLDRNMAISPVKIIQEVGKTFGANAVLIGHIYRWREREGTDYAINRPASVAFDLHLVRPADGAILWRGRFDKTQRSLFENLFDWTTFKEGGGRWMTADKLAMCGLKKLLTEMPGKQG